MENRKLRWVSLNEFHRGYAVNAALPGECSVFQNLDFWRDGSIRVRGGRTDIVGDLGARAQGISSAYPGGVKKWVYVYDGKIHHSADPPAAPTGAALYSGGSTTNYPVFEQFGGKGIIINIDSKPVLYDGTTCTVLSAAPNTMTGIFHSEYLFVVGSSSARIYWSATSDITTWPAANYLDVGDTLEPVLAFAVLRDSLIIFKDNSTWELSGKNNDDFYLRRIHSSLGCLSQQSCVSMGESFVFFIFRGQLWNLSDGSNFASEQVSGELMNHSSGTIVLGWEREDQWLYAAVPTASDTGKILRYDMVRKVWLKETGDYCCLHFDKSIASLGSGSGSGSDGHCMYGGLRSNGKFHAFSFGTTDDGTAIPVSVKTRYVDCGLNDVEKHARTLILDGYTSSAGVTLNVYLRMNPGGTETTLTYSSMSLPCVVNLPKNRFNEIAVELTTTAGIGFRLKTINLGFLPVRRRRI